MGITSFLQQELPEIIFERPMFYRNDKALRVELGEGSFRESTYLPRVYEKALTLFEALHDNTHELLLIVDHDEDKKIGVFSKYIKSKSLLYHLQHEVIQRLDEEELTTYRFALHCKKQDIRYHALIKAICNQDLGMKPSVPQRVYFVNKTKKTVFYVYDDQGCDIVATTLQTLRPIYETFNDWLLDYDREQMNKLFSK